MGAIPHCSTGTPGPCWFESQCSDNDESATAQTVREMCQVIRQSADDPLIQDEARRCFAILNMCRPGSFYDLAARSAYQAAKARLKFKLDEISLDRLLNKRGERDFLQWPALIVRGKVREGDCDCFTMFMCALLEYMGVPWRIVTVKCDPKDPSRWAHVYAVIDLENGRRLPLDASHFKQPGEEVPAHHVFEYAEWGMDGERLPVQRNPIPMGHYRRRGMGAYGRRCGFGQDPAVDGSAGSIPVDPTTVDASGSSSGALFPYTTPISIPSGSAAPTSSGISPATTSALANLAAAWSKIAGQVIAPQTTIQTPQGLLISGPSGAITSTVTGSNILSGLTSASSSSLMPLLLIGGAGLLLFAFISKK